MFAAALSYTIRSDARKIEVVWIFLKKKEFPGFLFQISSFYTVFPRQKPPKRLLLQDYALWPAGQIQFPPFSAHGDGTS